MTKAKYVAVLEHGPEGFGVFFPDLPGCVSAGATVEEAVAGGAEALALHLEGMAEEGLTVPVPSSVYAHSKDDYPESDVVALLLIETNIAETRKESPVRLNVSLPETLVSRIDAAAEAHGLTRSGLLAVAARQWIATNRVEPVFQREVPFGLKPSGESWPR